MDVLGFVILRAQPEGSSRRPGKILRFAHDDKDELLHSEVIPTEAVLDLNAS